MGMWQDDHRSGPGVIVTLDGMYFEGSFTSDKMTVRIIDYLLNLLLLYNGYSITSGFFSFL